MTDQHDDSKLLTEWCETLTQRLELHGLALDIDAVLSLAGQAAHAVVRPAAPLTTFLVGYAAGRASAAGTISSDAAIETAITRAQQLVQEQSR